MADFYWNKLITKLYYLQAMAYRAKYDLNAELPPLPEGKLNESRIFTHRVMSAHALFSQISKDFDRQKEYLNENSDRKCRKIWIDSELSTYCKIIRNDVKMDLESLRSVTTGWGRDVDWRGLIGLFS